MLALLFAKEVPAQNFETVFKAPSSAVFAAVRSGHLLYALHDDALAVYDLTEPATPVELSRTPVEHSMSRFSNLARLTGLYLLDNLLCLASGYCLINFDISDPVNPLEIWRRPESIDFQIGAAYFEGNYGYLGVQGQLLSVDMTDPRSPQIALATDQRIGYETRIEKVEAFTYIASPSALNDESGSVKIFNSSNWGSPELVGQIPLSASPLDLLVVENTRLIVAHGRGISAYDLTNPASPEFERYHELVEPDNSFRKFEDLVRLLDYTNGQIIAVVGVSFISDILAIEYSNPQIPLVRKVVSGTSPTFFRDSDFLFVGTGSLEILKKDANDMFQHICFLGRFTYPRMISAHGDRLWVRDSDRGVILLDVSEPSNPLEIWSQSQVTLFQSINQRSDFFHVSNGEGLLGFFSFVNPDLPVNFVVPESMDISHAAMDLPYLFVGHSSGVFILESTDQISFKVRTNIALVDILGDTQEVNFGHVNGLYPFPALSYLIIGTNESYVLVSLSNDKTPVIERRFPLPEGAARLLDVKFDGEIGYFNFEPDDYTHPRFFVVSDWSDPLNPELLDQLDGGDSSISPGRMAFLSPDADPWNNEPSILILDTSNPRDIGVIARTSPGYFALGLSQDGSTVFASPSDGGFEILKYNPEPCGSGERAVDELELMKILNGAHKAPADPQLDANCDQRMDAKDLFQYSLHWQGGSEPD